MGPDRSSGTARYQPFYHEIGLFKDDHAIVRLDDNYGLVRKEGKEVLPLEWKEITRLGTGNYLLTDAAGRKGIADSRGRIMLMPAFTSITDTHVGLLVASQNGKTE